MEAQRSTGVRNTHPSPSFPDVAKRSHGFPVERGGLVPPGEAEWHSSRKGLRGYPSGPQTQSQLGASSRGYWGPWAASRMPVVPGIKEKKDLGVSPSPCVGQQGFLDQSAVHLLQEPRLEADFGVGRSGVNQSAYLSSAPGEARSVLQRSLPAPRLHLMAADSPSPQNVEPQETAPCARWLGAGSSFLRMVSS